MWEKIDCAPSCLFEKCQPYEKFTRIQWQYINYILKHANRGQCLKVWNSRWSGTFWWK